MKPFFAWIDLLGCLRKIRIEEKQYGKYAEHITDIIVAYQDKGERNYIKLIALVKNELLDTESKEGKPDKSIYPHRVALLTNRVCGECIENRESKYRYFAGLFCMSMQIIAEAKTAETCF